MSPHLWWYLSRAAGLTSMALAMASVTTGLIVTGRLSTTRIRLPWSNDLHRFLSGLTLAFLALHISTLALDSYAPFSIQAMLLPGAAPWRPGAMAIGICGLYTLVVIDVSSRFRAKLSKRVWRSLHALSILVYITALTHAFMAGPDTSLPGVQVIVGAVVALDIGLLVRRIHRSVVTNKAKQAKQAGVPVPERKSPEPVASEA